jgi:chemotaxis protein histidine kinase CheA
VRITTRRLCDGGALSCRIEIEDDGAGLDLPALRSRLAGRVGSEAARTVSDAAVMQTVFFDGISTAQPDSVLSGEGLGMSAIKGEVDRLGGGIAMSSLSGQGTTLTITVPIPGSAKLRCDDVVCQSHPHRLTGTD